MFTKITKFNSPNCVRMYPRSTEIPSIGPEVVVVVVVTVAIL